MVTGKQLAPWCHLKAEQPKLELADLFELQFQCPNYYTTRLPVIAHCMNIAIHHLGHAHILISINSNRTHTHFLFNDPSFPDLCQGGLRPSQETSLEATGAGFLQCSSSYSANGREPNKSVLNLVPRLSTGCYPQLHRRAACRQSILKITIPTIYVDPSPSTVKNCGRTDGWADRHPPVTQTLLYYAGSVNKSL